MPKHIGRESAWANAINSFISGYQGSKKRKEELEDLVSQRELQKLSAAIQLENAARGAYQPVYNEAGVQIGQKYAPGMEKSQVDFYRGKLGMQMPQSILPPTEMPEGTTVLPAGKFVAGTRPQTQRNQVGMSQFVGQTPEGEAVVFQPTRGGGGFTTMPLPAGGTVQPKVSPTLPAEQVAQTSNLEVLGTSIKQMNDNFNEKFVGPVASRSGKAKQYAQPFANEQAGKFYSALADVKNQLIYLRSGKQINEQEFERLRATLPEETKSPVDFKARMDNFYGIYNSIMQSRQKAFGQAGYRNIVEPKKFNPIPTNNDPLGLRYGL